MAMLMKLEMAKTLMMAVVEAKRSRQVVAAVASALLRAGSDDTEQDCGGRLAKMAVQKLDLHEEVIAIVEESFGPGLGIGTVCKRLRDGGYTDVANSVSSIHRGRKQAAHPMGCMASGSRAALQQTRRCRRKKFGKKAGNLKRRVKS